MIRYIGRDYPNPKRDSEQDTALFGKIDAALVRIASNWLGIGLVQPSAFGINVPADDAPWVAVHLPTRARGKTRELVELAVLQLAPGAPAFATTNQRYARRCVVWCTPDEIGTNEELRGKILLLV